MMLQQTDLKIGCRYRWTDEDGHQELVVVWALRSDTALVYWADGDADWVPRDELRDEQEPTS